MLRPHRRAAFVGAALGVMSLLAACAAGGPSAATGSRADGGAPGTMKSGPISVVASTNVWGDIAAQLGGSRVRVTSLIHGPGQDPHEFEPSGRDELALSRAEVVIVNGGGYDSFMDRMLDALGNRPIVVTAVEAASGVPSVEPDNEHVWFDLDAVAAVAEAIDHAFAEVDPADRAEFADATATFVRSLSAARAELAGIAQTYAHTPVAVTEPLPLYLTAAAGLDNVMPAAFTDATEEGIDVAPSDMADVLGMFSQRRVKLLLYNEQTTSAQTQQVLRAADRNGVPVVPVTEVLPVGQHYQQWMGGIVRSMARLLGGATT